MKNSWKGLVIGGLTGIAGGLALDILEMLGHKTTAAAERIHDRAPEAGEWVRDVSEQASHWLRRSDAPEKVRHLAQRIVDSDLGDQARNAASKVKEVAKDTASAIQHSQ